MPTQLKLCLFFHLEIQLCSRGKGRDPRTAKDTFLRKLGWPYTHLEVQASSCLPILPPYQHPISLAVSQVIAF